MISPHFMESESLLPRLKVPATCPYPEPDQSSPFPLSHFIRIYYYYYYYSFRGISATRIHVVTFPTLSEMTFTSSNVDSTTGAIISICSVVHFFVTMV